MSASTLARFCARPKPRVFVFLDIKENAYATALDPERGGVLVGVSRPLFERMNRIVWEARGEGIHDFAEVSYVRGREVRLPFAPLVALAVDATIPENYADTISYRQIDLRPEIVAVDA